MNTKEEKKVDNCCADGLSCGCGCCEVKVNKLNEIKEKRILSLFKADIIKLIISFVLLILALIFKEYKIISNILYIASVLTSGYELIIKCTKNISKGKFFDETTLMLIASVTAFVIGEVFEGAFIIFLYNLGEFLESVATTSSRRKISGLTKLKAYNVHHFSAMGVEDVEPSAVKIGEMIEVRKGERIPIDGILLGGTCELDMKAITGESNYYTINSGEEVYSGAINVGNSIVVKTTKLYKDSTVERIISLVEGANFKKAKSQKFITSFARVYTPIIAVLAILIALVPPLFDGMMYLKWIYKALSFLVVSCPCALVISVPLAYFVSIGNLAKKGVLVKGSSILEKLSNVDGVIFDKTGTITEGNFSVEKVVFENNYGQEIIERLAILENFSNHPISKCIVSNFGVNKKIQPTNLEELTGLGIKGIVDGYQIIAGNHSLVSQYNLNIEKEEYVGTIIYVLQDGVLCAKVYLVDKIKGQSFSIISEFKKMGIKHTAIISGDKREIVECVGKSIGVESLYAEKLPEEKLSCLKSIKENLKTTVYVGDGINDSPCLAISDVGIAMGGLGSEIAVENSDVVILDDDIGKLPMIIKQAKKVKRTVLTNIIMSLAVKLIIMALGIIFMMPVWVAMLGDVGVMLLAVVNSLLGTKI